MKDSNRKENIRKFPNFDDCIVYCKFRGKYCNPDCPCYEKSDAIQRVFCEITQALILLPKCLREELRKENEIRKQLERGYKNE